MRPVSRRSVSLFIENTLNRLKSTLGTFPWRILMRHTFREKRKKWFNQYIYWYMNIWLICPSMATVTIANKRQAEFFIFHFCPRFGSSLLLDSSPFCHAPLSKDAGSEKQRSAQSNLHFQAATTANPGKAVPKFKWRVSRKRVLQTMGPYEIKVFNPGGCPEKCQNKVVRHMTC